MKKEEISKYLHHLQDCEHNLDMADLLNDISSDSGKYKGRVFKDGEAYIVLKKCTCGMEELKKKIIDTIV